MFKFEELQKIHVEITSNCQASCPMCARNYHGGKLNPNIRIQEWTLTDFITIISPEILNQINSLHICGTFGEPILNGNLIDMCNYLKREKFNGEVTIHTNGSARGINWWKQLAESLPKNHLVVFALDGLEDTHSIYRIGTNFKTIIRNAKTFISNGGKAEWAFIKFQHNEHQVDAARSLAYELGFSRFSVKNSKRFNGEAYDVLDNKDKKIYELKPSSDNKIIFFDKTILKTYKQLVSESKLECQSIDKKEIYIDAGKNLFPCCYTAADLYLHSRKNDDLYLLKEKSKQEVERIVNDLGGLQTLNENTSIKDIFNTAGWQNVWNKHLEKKPLVCVSNCGIHPKNNATTDNQIAMRINFQ